MRDRLKRQTFLRMARQLSRLSTCKRLSVGAIITDRQYRVLSVGYNGSVKDGPHCDRSRDPCDCIHRQQNCIMFAGPHFQLPDKKVFCTMSPCLRCSKMMAQFKIKQVYYIKEHISFKTVSDYLDRNNIKHERVSIT